MKIVSRAVAIRTNAVVLRFVSLIMIVILENTVMVSALNYSQALRVPKILNVNMVPSAISMVSALLISVLNLEVA
jgi:hypothetical protein